MTRLVLKTRRVILFFKGCFPILVQRIRACNWN